MNRGLMRRNDGIFIEKLPSKKLPALTVHIGNEVYKVASFHDATTANWFEEFCEEFFDGYVTDLTKETT